MRAAADAVLVALHSHGLARMHELAVMESVVDAVIAQTARLDPHERIALVRLEIGRLAGIDVAALRFAFDVCCEATVLDGAALDIVMIAGRARCRACSAEAVIDSYVVPCAACGSFDRELVGGTELRLRDVEVV